MTYLYGFASLNHPEHGKRGSTEIERIGRCATRAGLLHLIVALAIQTVKKAGAGNIGEDNKFIVVRGAYTLQQGGRIGSIASLCSFRHVTQGSVSITVGIELKNVNRLNLPGLIACRRRTHIGSGYGQPDKNGTVLLHAVAVIVPASSRQHDYP